MPEYLSPGVYIEERDDGPKPIEGVGTAMPAFVGFTEKAPLDSVTRESLAKKPVLVTSWGQYVEKFGELVDGYFLPLSVYGYFQNGGTRCYVVSIKQAGVTAAELKLKAPDTKLGVPPELGPRIVSKKSGPGSEQIWYTLTAKPAPAAAAAEAPSAAENGTPADTAATGAESSSGKRTKAKSDTPPPPSDGAASSSASAMPPNVYVLNLFKGSMPKSRPDETHELVWNLKAMPDGKAQLYFTRKGVLFDSKLVSIPIVMIEDYEAAAALTEASIALADVSEQTLLKPDIKSLEPVKPSDYRGQVREDTGIEALEKREDITMVAVPDLMAIDRDKKQPILTEEEIIGLQDLVIAHCTRMQDRVAILDVPPTIKDPQQVDKYRMQSANFDSSYAALYYPWIKVQDPSTNKTIEMPPSGYIAGIWARSDNTRGVHKAPANEVVRGAVGLSYNVSKGEQDTLNPNGINCIRAMPGMGIRVWGARTVSSNPSWRYLNVRRLFNYVEKSIERGTQWVVFEPNDHKLWSKVRRDVNAFLMTVWRDGALFGMTPEQAFYVKCDETNNPPDQRDLGRLIVEIGMAPVKPAEFVIFRISQWAGPGADA